MHINIKKAKKEVCCIFMILIFIGLTGCNSSKEGAGISTQLDQSLAKLESSGAYSYKVETTTQGSDISKDVSQISVIEKPYAIFTDEKESGGTANLKIQLYQRENTDGSMDTFTRSMEGGTFGQWNKNHILPEYATLQLPIAKESMKRNIELLRKNKSSFQEVKEEKLGDEKTTVLKGVITPDSAAQVYMKYLRPYYQKMGVVEDKEVTVEAAKEEIKTSNFPELKTGIPALVLSSSDVPVTIWIDEKTGVPIKVKLDKTEFMKLLVGDGTIKQVVTVYTLKAQGSQVSVPVPEGIK